MARQGRSFKRRTVKRWMLSYLFATLIPLLTILIASIVTLSFNSSSLTYSNSIAASYVQSSFRDVLTRINEIKAEIIVDTDFNDLRSAKQLSEISSLELSYNAADIRRLEQTSTNIDGLFLFSLENDWFIGNQSWGRVSDIVGFSNLPVSQSVMDKVLSIGYINDVFIYDLSENRIMLVLPMTYIRSSGQNNIIVGVIVSKDKLFPPIIDQFHDVVVYSERQDCIVYSLSGKYTTGIADAALGSLVPGSTSRMDKDVASVGENPILGLKCIVLMDRNTYFHSLYIIIIGVAAVLFFAGTFGAIFANRIVRRDWSRYQEAVEASGVDIENIPMDSNTYTPFVSSVSDLKARQEVLSDVISRQNSSLVEGAIQKLISGDATVSKDTLEALGVTLVSDHFCVVIAKGSDVDIRQYLFEVDDNSLVIPFQSDYGDSFIINTIHDDENFFVDSFVRIQQDGVLESLSASYLHAGLESIRDCFIEAISVHEYQKDHDIAFMSYSELVSNTRQNTYQYTLEENMMLQKALKEGDAEKAKGIVNKVIERNRENGVSPKTLRFLLFNISGTIIRTINSLDDRYSEVIPEISFPPILQSHNFQKSLSGVEEIIDSTCYSISVLSSSLEDSSSEIYQTYRKVVSYIHENYGNAMMNVSSIAYNFSISIAYLSRIFKKYQGINISEYITSYRIDRAKELLAEGEMVGDVVDKCGFGSLRTFLRVFKAVEGLTPGQYKDSVSKEN